MTSLFLSGREHESSILKFTPYQGCNEWGSEGGGGKGGGLSLQLASVADNVGKCSVGQPATIFEMVTFESLQGCQQKFSRSVSSMSAALSIRVALTHCPAV